MGPNNQQQKICTTKYHNCTFLGPNNHGDTIFNTKFHISTFLGQRNQWHKMFRPNSYMQIFWTKWPMAHNVLFNSLVTHPPFGHPHCGNMICTWWLQGWELFGMWWPQPWVKYVKWWPHCWAVLWGWWPQYCPNGVCVTKELNGTLYCDILVTSKLLNK